MARAPVLLPACPDSMPKPRGLSGAYILLQKRGGGECSVCFWVLCCVLLGSWLIWKWSQCLIRLSGLLCSLVVSLVSNLLNNYRYTGATYQIGKHRNLAICFADITEGKCLFMLVCVCVCVWKNGNISMERDLATSSKITFVSLFDLIILLPQGNSCRKKKKSKCEKTVKMKGWAQG